MEILNFYTRSPNFTAPLNARVQYTAKKSTVMRTEKLSAKASRKPTNLCTPATTSITQKHPLKSVTRNASALPPTKPTLSSVLCATPRRQAPNSSRNSLAGRLASRTNSSLKMALSPTLKHPSTPQQAKASAMFDSTPSSAQSSTTNFVHRITSNTSRNVKMHFFFKFLQKLLHI